MRLAELFEPQKPTPKTASASTVPEVFILESLELEDETEERREGAVLASVLKMCGKNPLYYYIRTKTEMEYMATVFEKSGYRYLHISCHGGDTSLNTTLDSISYKDFANIFKGRLKDRRLFVSACSAGNPNFAEIVHGRNNNIISVAAPAKNIYFDHAVAFWSAFYVKSFSVNANSMKSDRIMEVLGALADLFGEPMHYSRQVRGKWVHEVIDGGGKHKGAKGGKS